MSANEGNENLVLKNNLNYFLSVSYSLENEDPAMKRQKKGKDQSQGSRAYDCEVEKPYSLDTASAPMNQGHLSGG